MERGIGEFVVEGAPLMSVAGLSGPDDEAAAELKAVYVISRQRTVQQDAGFGIRQIVDIAMKALSPGVNDTTTAVMCVDYLGAILARLAVRGLRPLTAWTRVSCVSSPEARASRACWPKPSTRSGRTPKATSRS
jgi:uncharacterized membrane protein